MIVYNKSVYVCTRQYALNDHVFLTIKDHMFSDVTALCSSLQQNTLKFKPIPTGH